MTHAVSPRLVVELAVRVHGRKKSGYVAAAKLLGIADDTSRKIENGDASGAYIKPDALRNAFNLLIQQRIAQIRAELNELEQQC
jgi:hypothetical protein